MTFPTFTEFFHDLWGHDPFPWQGTLAEQAAAGHWPDYIAVPTGSGKTACIDIAVYALAAQAERSPEERNAPRRIFFIVNRRVIVDEAFRRAADLAERLLKTDKEPRSIQDVASALRSLSPEDFSQPPLDCVQLRGAIYRDNRWARSLTQPTVIASTIDQVGSRLLFRGYGLSPSACPLHAALVAHDSLLLVDEAHISRPFTQTLSAVRRFRRISEASNNGNPPVSTPFHFVQMTATPPAGDSQEIPSVLGLDREKDFNHPVLGKRLRTSKPARLKVASNVKGKQATHTIAKKLVEETDKLISEYKPASLAVMVNRVATARAVTALLQSQQKEAKVSLMIGRMRPIDRDSVTKEVEAYLKTGTNTSRDDDSPRPLRIVVATQCLEVGADLDFDALITECASLDALRQRFGRLNRAARDIQASAVIVMRDDLVETSEEKLQEAEAKGQPLDPIYGNAVSRTWNWLQSVAADEGVDFGIASMDAMTAALSKAQRTSLSSPTQDAPVLFPAYLDAWAQTNPRPAPDPDPAIFIHGPRAGTPDIQVCWRADLPEEANPEHWKQAISLCPPSTPETLNVSISKFRDWFFQSTKNDEEESDLLTATPGTEDGRRNELREGRANAMIWQGLRESRFLKTPSDLRPGDTIVLPDSAGGWSVFGHFPDAPDDPSDPSSKDPVDPSALIGIDLGSRAFHLTRDREILRLRREFFPEAEKGGSFEPLLEWAENPDSDWNQTDIRKHLESVAESEEFPEELRQSCKNLIKRNFRENRYADGKGAVLESVGRLKQSRLFSAALDDQDDALSATEGSNSVTLGDHLRHVTEQLNTSLPHLPMKVFQDALTAAARMHDWGKLDERFQALLLRGDLNAAAALREPLAKSPYFSLSAREYQLARDRCGLPDKFRHEMLSLQLAESESARPLLANDERLAELTLHLIATHHGHGRPFAPVVLDPNPPPIEWTGETTSPALELTSQQRLDNPAHRIDSGIAERFWSLTRHFGWWGLAYLEAALRLADQQASEAETNAKTEPQHETTTR